jgi:nucleotide-binding universal stress UspA family protein
MYKKILVPLDGSASAEKALPHIYGLAERTNAEIVLLRLSRRPIGADLADDVILTLPLLENSEEEAERYLYDLLSHLPKTRVQVTARVASGPTAFAILDCAERAHADLIALPYLQGNAVQRWATGGIMRTVIHHAQVPVLLIPPSC